MKNTLTIILTSILVSCREDWTEHERFMNESDCFVYNREVESESLNNYNVEFIDTSRASGCVKTQLNRTYILNISKDYYITVYPNHPKSNLKLIEAFIKKFKTNDSRLSSFSRNKNKIYLTLSKKYINPIDKTFHNKYFEWKYQYLTKKSNRWEIDSSELTTLWPWGE